MKGLRSIRYLVLAPAALLLPACMTSTTTTRSWGEPYYEVSRPGTVELIRETVERREGNPVGGAVAGALIGGVLGHAVTGRGPGALLGATGGAALGAHASQGSGEARTYEVFVRYDDGGRQVFVYSGYPPFRVGEPVVLTSRGLIPR